MSERPSPCRRHALLTVAALLLVAATAAAAEPQDVRRLLAQWRVDEAERVLGELRHKTPDDPRLLALEGWVRFHRGEYERAAQQIEKATGSGPGARAGRAMLQLVRSTAAVVAGYVERRSAGGHFRFRVPRGKDELLVPFAGEVLETLRQRLKADLGYAPDDAIRVEVYPEPAVLARVSPLTKADIERTGTVALCKYNRLMIVSPRAMPRGYGWLDTIAHEYVHLVLSRLSHNALPIWLQEGLAKFFEARWRLGPEAPPPMTPGQEHLLASAIRGRGKLVRWADMHPSMAKLPSQRATALAFAQVQTAVQFIAQRGDRSALRQLIDRIREGASDWAAVAAVTHLSPRRFDSAYRQYVRGLKLRRLPGLVPPRMRFGRRPTREQRMARMREGRAREHFRLADMLRQRQLTRAAIVEYRKARTLVGERDVFVSNALARAYLEVGSADQAIDTLLPVLEYYPELAGPQVTVGMAYLRAGDRRAATEHLRVALRVNPFNPELHCGLGQALGDKSGKRHRVLCDELKRR